MDAHEITDIDKLLDALELQQEKELKNEIAVKTKTESGDRENNELPETAISATGFAQSATPISNNRYKQNFVNVSNVFNSLHEYVGIDIKSNSASLPISNNEDQPQTQYKSLASDVQNDLYENTETNEFENAEQYREQLADMYNDKIQTISSIVSITSNNNHIQISNNLVDDNLKEAIAVNTIPNDIINNISENNINNNNNIIIEKNNDTNVPEQKQEFNESADEENDVDDQNDINSNCENRIELPDNAIIKSSDNCPETSDTPNIPDSEPISEKVIGFESTVDDISDTELEYLQDLENDENLKLLISTSSVTNETEKEVSVKEDDENKNDISNINSSSVADDDDRISQASTLEINEAVKSADMDFDLPGDVETSKSSSQVSECLEISMVRTVEIMDIPASTASILNSETVVPNEVEKDNPNTVENKIQYQLQRPISLDLATNASTALPIASAGSTPLIVNMNKHLHLNPEQEDNVELLTSSTTTSTTSSTTSSLDEFGIQAGTNSDRNMEEPKSESYTNEEQVEQINDERPVDSSVASDITSTSSSSSTSSSQDQQQLQQEAAHEANADPSSVLSSSNMQLGRVQPYWVPDNSTNNCMQCNLKFSLIKRRHHCRCCGQLLCSSCCCLKAKLEYMNSNIEVRICIHCDDILNKQEQQNLNINSIINHTSAQDASSSSSAPTGPSLSPDSSGITSTIVPPNKQPNPNNPMEYCSQISPLQQQQQQSPISVMVPIGVLKRDGVPPKSSRKDKAVIFSDGIRPGCDLTELDESWGSSSNEYTATSRSSNKKSNNRRVQTPPGGQGSSPAASTAMLNIKLPQIDDVTKSYIDKKPTSLPPVYIQESKTEYKYVDVANDEALVERLKNQVLKFAIQRNFYVYCKIVKLSCCVNKLVINFTTCGMHHVGQDEIVILLEIPETPSETNNSDIAKAASKQEKLQNIIPKDIFLHLNDIYMEADKGNIITELGFSIPTQSTFLSSKEHGGFLYIRTTFQCMQNIKIPESPYLIGVLIHRWELPWAKIFPLRLMLRLGALYRYYPAPHISVCNRDSVYAEIAQTIINFLADFRTYSYTITTVRGMFIHMEDRKTSVFIPRNRYDQVLKTLNNSSDHILALGGNFSQKADGHLVCIQNTESGCSEMYSYTTQAINIQGQPRKVTGASFLVLNGALKTTSGLSGKCSIVEDGLMVQILPGKMLSIRESLKNMKDIEIVCGPIDADESQTEKIIIQWVDNDLNFNIGVFSPIDKKQMDGIPSIRVHRGFDYTNTNHIIRWTEVFIIQSDEVSVHIRDPIDISKLSEQIARSTCVALLSFLDLLAANDLLRIGLRVTLDPENVGFEAGSQHNKLAPIYMNALDNQLIKILHGQMTSLQINQTIVLELIFHILDK